MAKKKKAKSVKKSSKKVAGKDTKKVRGGSGFEMEGNFRTYQ